MGRKKLYEGMMCRYCGDRPASVKGLCKRCYSNFWYVNKNPTSNDHGHRGPSPTFNINKTLNLLDEGLSQSEIARIAGVSRQRINFIIKNRRKENIETR